MKAVSETKPKLETVPNLTDSDCSSGESDHEASESDESQDEESEIEKAEDDDEVISPFIWKCPIFEAQFNLMNV